MFLKRLELQGFKTFAQRTEFEFDSGITAVIGPNGSGKSNVADALRWILGEQSLRLLRAKRSEDLIFAGSPSRATAGMAEVSITLDNSDGTLALPQSEISVIRRAYRSGDIEYFVNKQRARLRDVLDLLAKANLGQNNYAVIGQGMVDTALSLKPEERRGLLEEAADIKRYYAKLNETQSKLATTEQNIVRANDIAAEIFPRLATLEKHAQLAQRRATLARELTDTQLLWFSNLWQKALSTMHETNARELEQRRAVHALEERQKALTQRLEEVRQAQAETRAALARWRTEAGPLRAEQETLAREIAVDGERLRTTIKQIDETREEIESIKRGESDEAEKLLSARAHLSQLEAECENAKAQAARVESELQSVRKVAGSAIGNLSTLRTGTIDLTASATSLQQRITQIEARRRALEREVSDRAVTAHRRRDETAQLQAKAASLDASIAELDKALGSAITQEQTLRKALADSQSRQEQLGDTLQEQRRQLHELQTRLDLAAKWEDSRAGYFTGVKAVLQASQASRQHAQLLTGIVGVVGKVIQTSARLETAIEVALGSRVQDVIVERWQDAEKAIAYLKSTSAGRATFLPLDTIKSSPASLPCSNGPGVLGIAADLVDFDQRFKSIADLLLGRTIVVEDLTIARRILKGCPAGWQIVTIAGEIVRSSGSVTGGSVSNQSHVLSRARELRELPDKIEYVKRQVEGLQDSLQEERSEYRHLQDQSQRLEREEREARSRRQIANERLSLLRQEMARLQSDLQWLDSHQQQASDELARLRSDEVACQEQLSRTLSESAVAGEALRAAEEDSLRLRQQEMELSTRLSDLRTAAALSEQKLKNQIETISHAEAAALSLSKQHQAKKARLDQIEMLRAPLEDRIALNERGLGEVKEKLGQIDLLVGPAEQESADLENEHNALLREEAELRISQHRTLLQLQQAALDAQRTRDELAALRQQIEDEIGVDRFDQEDNFTVSVEAPQTNVEREQRPPLRQEDIKRRIDQLKSELRTLVSVNPQAIEEYQEALSRYTFLTNQARDLQLAAESLQRVIAELHKTMKKRFEETFKAVAAEFQAYFQTLFGGGTARLTLTAPGDFTQTGIDIVAQPPGKRLQNLALLSGGERALTGVALMFALLKINPAPICVLYEVDAALDEANISRFCNALIGLSRNTQFIVITHNRGTMETADALYGVSMAEGGVSKVISLRLSDIQAKPDPQLAMASSNSLHFS